MPVCCPGAIHCDHRNSLRMVSAMTLYDMCADIAALLTPIPTHAEDSDELGDESSAQAAEAAWQEREEMTEDLRRAWSEGDIDPLLSTLSSLRTQRLQLEADMRLLIA